MCSCSGVENLRICLLTDREPSSIYNGEENHLAGPAGTFGVSQAFRPLVFCRSNDLWRYSVALQVGAFLTSPARCAAVDPPSNPDSPFVVISAPGTVGNCDDLTLEGSVTSASIGVAERRWLCLFVGWLVVQCSRWY